MKKNKHFHAGSFAPIVSEQSQVLIVGTMPGVASLEKQQYYGHPRNLFWPFLFEIFGKQFSEDYSERVKLIRDEKLALWDTLEYCEREGSLDSKIEKERPNDISGLLEQFSNIHTVVCNGQAAMKYFRRFQSQINIDTVCMPSTSPANASISRDKKYEQWARIKEFVKK